MVIIIARFVHALFYFWVFGFISVLLDLDHIIQVYRDGLEISIENLAYHGTRTLHIPVLILCGCICLITAALLIRFWYLSSRNKNILQFPQNTASKPYSTSEPIRAVKSSLLLRIATHAILSPGISRSRKPKFKKSQLELKEPTAVVVECPKCSEFIGVIPTNGDAEFPCPYCGINGHLAYE